MSAKTISWERDVRLVTNPIVLRQMLIVFLMVPVIVCGLLVLPLWSQDELDAMPQLMLLIVAVSAGIAVIGLLGALPFLGNRAHMRFSVNDSQAVAEVIDRRVATIGWLSLVLGILARKPGAAGSGLLTLSNTRQSARWSAIRTARFHDRSHVIELANGWRTVLVLYCEPSNYAAVVDTVRKNLMSRKGKQGRNPLWRAIAWTAAIFVASAPSFGLEYPFEIDIFAPMLLVSFAVASLWLIPLLAWATIVAAGLVVANLVYSASAIRESMFQGEASYRAFEVASGNDWMMFGLCLAGLAFIVWISVRLLQGRLVSVLMADMIEMGDS